MNIPAFLNDFVKDSYEDIGPISSYEPIRRQKKFETIKIYSNRGPLIINSKRWYFRLVHDSDKKRSRALMDDYSLNQLTTHLVVCFTPKYLPNSNKPFITKEGNQGRIYAYFDSYIEFYQYMTIIDKRDRTFYEIIFGELPQKPHFDIDINLEDVNEKYPKEDINMIGEIVKDSVISECINVLSENDVSIDINRDILIYSSHGESKRSYHIIINNKCHDDNKEAKAFYQKVVEKIRVITNGKYIEFIDSSLYSPRQQLRIVGSEKQGSGRIKEFHENFIYKNQQYKHIYNEEIIDNSIKNLVVIYESLVGFTSGCTYLPLFAPIRSNDYNNLADMADLQSNDIDYCINMMKEKIKDCPFSIKSVSGHIIILKRHGSSYCPMHNKNHEHENPYIYILSGKVYWDCRRDPRDVPKIFLGYLGYSYEELKSLNICEGEELYDQESETENFMFGEFNLGAPTLTPLKSEEKGEKEKNIHINIPIEKRLVKDVQNNVNNVSKQWLKKYTKKEAETVIDTGIFHGLKPKWS